MFLIGTYDRFIQKIKGREGKMKPKYLGVLFCDIEQKNVKEYILNYVDAFNNESGEEFDFYIPGYLEYKKDSTNMKIEFDDRIYEFNRKKYAEFCRDFSKDFDIEYPYVPTLVFLEYESGNFKNAKKSIFKLEEMKGGVMKSSEFFTLIFKAAQENNGLQDILDNIFKESYSKREIVFTILDKVIPFFSSNIEKYIEYKNNKSNYILK